MAAFTAKDVAELRKQTGCGMMDCKNALVAAEGNFEEAIKVLREKGIAATAKKQSRIAAEGIVDILTEGNRTAMIEVNSETDFVAKNETFRKSRRCCRSAYKEICRHRRNRGRRSSGKDFHNRRKTEHPSFPHCGRRCQFLYPRYGRDRRCDSVQCR